MGLSKRRKTFLRLASIKRVITYGDYQMSTITVIGVKVSLLEKMAWHEKGEVWNKLWTFCN